MNIAGNPACRKFTCNCLAVFVIGTMLAPAWASEAESPWLLTPTLSADPKLGTNIGAVAGYLHRFDPGSEQSMVAAVGTYSDTDSRIGGLMADLRWDGNRHKLQAGLFGGRIRNEYDDYLGTGMPARTEDNVSGYAMRYARRVVDRWYLGGQFVSTDYAINADGLLGDFLEQIGLTGFESTAIGVLVEFDDRDNTRNPKRGRRFTMQNLAYRESLGGKESFDVYRAEYVHFVALSARATLGIQVQGRWTDDAPLAGYSSVALRGYTMGNYLDKHYTHVDLDARFMITERVGVTAFGGAGCLYSSLSDCDSGDSIYPSIGVGISYLLKPEAGIVLRAEFAQGDSDNRAFYIRMGNPF
jgi:outer membrane protein assembly factor BamA